MIIADSLNIGYKDKVVVHDLSFANCKNKLNTYHKIWQILTIYAGKCGQVRCQSTLLESCSLRSSEEESCTIPRS